MIIEHRISKHVLMMAPNPRVAFKASVWDAVNEAGGGKPWYVTSYLDRGMCEHEGKAKDEDSGTCGPPDTFSTRIEISFNPNDETEQMLKLLDKDNRPELGLHEALNRGAA